MASWIAPVFSGLATIFGATRKPKAPGIDYQRLRDDAAAAGFNPLTALMAGGGQGYQREFSPDLASGGFVAEAIARGVDTIFSAVPERPDRAAQEARRLEATKAALSEAATGDITRRFGYGLTDVAPFKPEVEHSTPKFRPLRSPAYRRDYIPVIDARTGSSTMIDKALADRLGIEPWGMWIGGDDEETWGELAGGLRSTAQGVNAPFTPGYAPGGFPSSKPQPSVIVPPAGGTNAKPRWWSAPWVP